MKKMRKGLSIIIAFTIIFSMGITSFAGLIDVNTHWANKEINYFVEKGILNGYPDDTFKPNNNITKAEIYKIINKVIGYTETSEIDFLDVKESDWFYNDVTKGVKAGYITERSGGNLLPNTLATREEVAKIIGLAFGLSKEESKSANYFLDGNNISDQAKGYVGILKDKGYISGYPDGTFKPKGQITRAEVVKMINNITGEIVDTAGTVTKNIEGNLLVNTADVILKDMVIKGDLYLTEGIGNGDVTLDNVVVKGETFIRGGGENSIKIKDSSLGKITIDKKDGNIRVVVEGNIKIDEIILEDNAILVVKDGATVGTVKAVGKSEIKVEKGAAIEELEVSAKDVEVKSEGKIDLVVANEKVKVNDTTVSKGTEAKVSSSGKVEEIKKEEPKKSTGSSGGGGGGGSTDPKPDPVKVSAISVKGEGGATTITTNGGTLQMSATVTPNNADNKAVTWSVTNGTGSATIDQNGLLTAVKNGTVTVKATAKDGSGVTGQLVVTISGQKEEPVEPTTYTVTFSVTPEGATVVVKDSDENEVAAEEDGTYKLEAGTYSYTVSEEGYVTKTGTITVLDKDETVTVELPVIPEEANFVVVNSFGIHTDKVYVGYKLKDKAGQQIALVASNIESMTVKNPDGTTTTLTVGDDSDPLLWFNVEKAEGNYVYTVVTKDEGAKTYEATLTWVAPKTAIWEATGREGDHEGVIYVEYKLMDNEKQVSLKEGEVKLIASKDADGKWIALEPNTDETLWFNKVHATGQYEFLVVTENNTIYKATLDYVGPAVMNVTKNKGYSTIQAAIDEANDGDTIFVATGEYSITETINVNKKVVVEGAPDFGTKITTSGDKPVFTLSAAAKLKEIFINKTDKTNQNLITITANDVTVENCKFIGQYTQGDEQVTRAIVPHAGTSGYTLQGNHFENLRQPAYLEGQGTVKDNFVKNTRGWVVCVNHEVTFTGNTFEGNAVDIAIISNNQKESEYYKDVVGISTANNGAFVENQLTRVSAINGKQVITNADALVKAINEAQDEDVLELAPGIFSINQTLHTSKPLTIKGSGIGRTILDVTNVPDGAWGVLINKSNTTLSDMTIKSDKTENYNNNLKVSDEGSSPIGHLNNIKIENVDIRGGKGLDIYNATVTLNNCSVSNSKGASIAVSNGADVKISNTTTSNGAWGSLGVMYKEGYSKSTVTIQGKNDFNEGVLYSEGYTKNGDQIIGLGNEWVSYINERNQFVWVTQLPRGAYITRNDKTWGYHTIQSAIDKASDGDTILVVAGEYNGFTINKNNITIKAIGDVKLTPVHFSGSVQGNIGILVDSAKGVVIDGFTIVGDGEKNSNGLVGFNIVEVTISNTMFNNLHRGIYANSVTPNKNIRVTLTSIKNKFDNCEVGVGGTEYTTLSATGNKFTTTVEAIGLGVGVEVYQIDDIVKYLYENNIFNTTNNEAVVDWRNGKLAYNNKGDSINPKSIETQNELTDDELTDNEELVDDSIVDTSVEEDIQGIEDFNADEMINKRIDSEALETE